MTDDRLISLLTKTMEEYGMPVYKDKFPAKDIMMIVRDHGYDKSQSAELAIILQGLVDDFNYSKCGDYIEASDIIKAQQALSNWKGKQK